MSFKCQSGHIYGHPYKFYSANHNDLWETPSGELCPICLKEWLKLNLKHTKITDEHSHIWRPMKYEDWIETGFTYYCQDCNAHGIHSVNEVKMVDDPQWGTRSFKD